jgi:hypothetical protein
MIDRLAEPEPGCHTVVVVDEPRGSREDFIVSGDHDPGEFAAATLAEHDTATKRPPGVTVTVYSAEGDELATVTTKKGRSRA